VLQEDGAYLTYLIDLRFVAVALQNDFLLDARSSENVMTAMGTLFKAEP
jgi:hypothetical protein